MKINPIYTLATVSEPLDKSTSVQNKLPIDPAQHAYWRAEIDNGIIPVYALVDSSGEILRQVPSPVAVAAYTDAITSKAKSA